MAMPFFRIHQPHDSRRSNHSMDIGDEEGSMADETITAQEQAAPFVDMAEQAGV